MMHNWIEWYANQNQDKPDGPLPANALVAVMMLDGEVWADEPAGAYNWAVQDAPGEIVAYKHIGWVLNFPVNITEINLGPPWQELLAHFMQHHRPK